jgi:hypothetical protein
MRRSRQNSSATALTNGPQRPPTHSNARIQRQRTRNPARASKDAQPTHPPRASPLLPGVARQRIRPCRSLRCAPLTHGPTLGSLLSDCCLRARPGTLAPLRSLTDLARAAGLCSGRSPQPPHRSQRMHIYFTTVPQLPQRPARRKTPILRRNGRATPRTRTAQPARAPTKVGAPREHLPRRIRAGMGGRAGRRAGGRGGRPGARAGVRGWVAL